MGFITVNTKEIRIGSNPATPTNRILKPSNYQIFHWIFLYLKVYLNYLEYRDVAQSGSVHAWGAWGHRFKSCHPDIFL